MLRIFTKHVKNHLRYVKQLLEPTKLHVTSIANPLVLHALRVGMTMMITHVMKNLLKIHVELVMGVISPIGVRFAVVKLVNNSSNFYFYQN